MISSVNERIRQLENIINSNQKFIDLCEFIKNKAIERVKKSDASIQNEIYDKKGNRVTDKRKLVKRVFHSTYTFPFYVIFVFVNNQTISDKVCGTTVQMSH